MVRPFVETALKVILYLLPSSKTISDCFSCTCQSSVPTLLIINTALLSSKDFVASAVHPSQLAMVIVHPSSPLEKSLFFNIFSPVGCSGISGASIFSKLILSMHIRCFSVICSPPTAPIEILKMDFKSVSFFI